MIVDFSAKNYLSIQNEITLSFLANKKNDSHDLLIVPVEKGRYHLHSFSALYGPNASGKSNIIKALSELRRFVLYSHKLDLDIPIPAYKPFRLNKSMIGKPTKFELEFLVENIRYVYMVEFDQKEILEEELNFFPEGKIANLFKRAKGAPIKFGTYFKGEKKSLETFLLPNRLFLSLAANSQNDLLKPVYRFFMNGIDIHVRMDSSHTPFHNTTIELRNKGVKFQKLLSIILKAADLNVKDVKLVEDQDISSKIEVPKDMPIELKNRIMNDLRYKPYIGHPVYNNEEETNEIEYFDLEDEESTGTFKMYDIAGEVLKALRNGTVLIIDEFNSGLHPLLNKFLVELFINPKINRYNAQLFISTHDTCVLDLKRLRREQIWFTEKDTKGATQLFSLDEYDKNLIRDYSSYGKNYLEGRFRAVPAPNFSDLLEGLFDA